jgi:hypothetical protein
MPFQRSTVRKQPSLKISQTLSLSNEIVRPRHYSPSTVAFRQSEPLRGLEINIGTLLVVVPEAQKALSF